MNFLDEFADRRLVLGLAERIRRLAADQSRPLTFMEVCGTHTMAIHRYGLAGLLPPQVRLISGPGCPVCVTASDYIDRAIAYARLPDITVATFGDMARVPGSSSCLLEERARGGDIRIVHSPLDAVELAARQPHRRVIFLGVGFETTTPTVAASILVAAEKNLRNYLVLSAHKTILPAMRSLAADPDLGLDGFICPAHVSAVIGSEAYRSLAQAFGVPCVVTGFEPADILCGIEMLVRQAIEGRPTVENEYGRVVTASGNRQAQAVMAAVFTPGDARWRGLGVVPGSGQDIREEFRVYDAKQQVEVELEVTREPPGCLCGEILKGKLAPADCPLFGGACTPQAPAGPCMVSSEGACAAAHAYS